MNKLMGLSLCTSHADLSGIRKPFTDFIMEFTAHPVALSTGHNSHG